MTSKLFASVLCIVLSPLLAAQQICQVEEPALETAPAETLYAYRSSINLLAELGYNRAQTGEFGSQYGLSIIPFEVPLKLVPADPAALAHATVGTTLTFWILKDVTVRGGISTESRPMQMPMAGNRLKPK